MTELFAIRDALPDDVPFVFNSWLKSYRDSPMVKSIPNTIYYDEHHRVIERLLQSPDIHAHVACNPEDHNQIYGYVIAEKHIDPDIKCVSTTFHWIYCKHPFRGNGIAKALYEKVQNSYPALPGHQTFYTHRVKNVENLIGDRLFVFNPYALYKVAK